MDREGDLGIAGRSRRLERAHHQQSTTAAPAILGQQRDSQLWRVVIDVAQPDAATNAPHPAGAYVLAFGYADDADVTFSAPAFGVDRDGGLVEDFARAKASGWRVPEGEMEPVPKGFLVGRFERADRVQEKCA